MMNEKLVDELDAWVKICCHEDLQVSRSDLITILLVRGLNDLEKLVTTPESTKTQIRSLKKELEDENHGKSRL